MKYLLGALVALMVVSSGAALADTTSYATTHVYVNVVSNISVQATDAYFDLGEIQTGDFYGEIPFRVDANTEQVTFWADASYLYKGNDPYNDDVLPILAKQARNNPIASMLIAAGVGWLIFSEVRGPVAKTLGLNNIGLKDLGLPGTRQKARRGTRRKKRSARNGRTAGNRTK